jgi:PhnB protein
MARVNTYLNFPGNTEEAFNFYKRIFGTEFVSITRMKDMPRPEGAPTLSESDANKIMNVQLPIVNGHVLMATDALESLGHKVNIGNNVNMPWGALWGSCQDQYGIRWMVSCAL